MNRRSRHLRRWSRACESPPSEPTSDRHNLGRDLTDAGSEKKDLEQLSHLGHFLKGSSATLGLTKVKDSCEKIQHYGAHKDEAGTRDEKDDKVCLDRVRKTLEQVMKEYAEVEKMLKDYYTAREEKQ